MSSVTKKSHETKISRQRAVPRGLSLRVLLAVSFAGLISFSALVSGGILTWQNFQGERETAIHSLAFRAETTAKEISTLMAEMIATMRTTSHFLHDGAAGDQHLSHALTHILGQFKGFQAASVLNASGREVAKVSRIVTTNELTFVDYKNTPLWSVVETGKTYLGSVSISKDTSAPVVFVAVPIKDNVGQFKGAIVGELSLRFLWSALSKRQLGAGHAAYVINHNGRVLGHSLLVQVLRGIQLDEALTKDIFSERSAYTARETVNRDDQNVLLVSVVLDAYDWAAIYEIPVSEAYLPAFRSAMISAIVMLVSAFFAAVIGVVIAKHLTRPLQHLSETASRIAKEDFSSKLPNHGTLEIQSLSAAFAAMATRLEMVMNDLSEAKEKAERQSLQDGLTGLANRRRFDQYFGREWHRAARAQTKLSLILMDIDHFKLFNDHYGHSAGDECLKQVSSILSEVVGRGTDMVARYGGEEFVCVLPDTDSKGAALIAENLRAAVSGAAIAHETSKVADYVTMSFGVATASPHGDMTGDKTGDTAPLALVDAADQALYKAKASGRNTVVVSAAD
mgnify:CR=1 FL=1